MAEEAESAEGALRLRQTSVITPLVEHSSSRQSVAAYQEEYQSSLSGPSRPTSSASNAGLLDDMHRYSTPPSSPRLRNTERVRQDTQAQDTDTAAAQEANPSNTRDDRQIRRKPVQDGSSSSSSGSPQQERFPYPPPRTSMNRSPPSPSSDDTPYIRFALDQLTRDEEVRGSRMYPARDRWSTAPQYGAAGMPMATDLPGPGSYPVPRPQVEPRSGVRPRQPTSSNQAGQVQYYDPLVQSRAPPGIYPRPVDPRSADKPLPAQPRRQRSDDSAYHTPPQESTAISRITPIQTTSVQSRDPMAQPDVFVPYTSDVPSLRFLPGILRPLWLSIFIFLCVLMLAAITFSGAYSIVHNGLWEYTTFGGTRYFVFQYLPTMCGIFLLLWLFQIQIAVQRMSPFIAMASDNYKSRTEGPLMPFQPTNFLLPKLFYFRAGQPIIGVCMLVFWLQIFTIPLLATAYNALFFDQPQLRQWRWTAVQGVVWTVFVFYFLLIVALVLLGFWLWRQRTGLKWDPRSLADLIALVDRSNIIRDYRGSETFRSAKDFRARLGNRSDRLGYWTSSRRPNEVFYGIGEEGGTTRRYSLEAGRMREKGPAEGVSGFYPDTPTTYEEQPDLENGDEFERVRYRYIPWYLNTSFVLLWIVAAIILYLAFLVVSFVNNAVVHGFIPLLPVRATPAGFSSTNFLYSFIPATIAELIFLSWLSVDYAFRRLQPYAAMSSLTNTGANALDSLLLDYPSRLPFSVTITALLSKNLRVAWFSFLSLIAACLPIFAGGCFWAQWYIPTQEVRVAVNPTAFIALCVFLALFAFSLPLLLFGMRERRLPHSCTTLADQISFLYGSQILGEREWRAPLGSKTEMTTRLLTAATPQERAFDGGRFIFGRFLSRDGRTHLGVERIGREGNKLSKRSWRGRGGIMTPPPPVAKSAPRVYRTQGATIIGTGSSVGQGEGFPALSLVGATAAGAGAAAAGSYAYNRSQQEPLRESEEIEYMRRQDSGPFVSPVSPSAPSAAPISSVDPRIISPISPISPVDDDNEEDALYAEARTFITATPVSRSYVRQPEGDSFASPPTSSVYPSGEATPAAQPAIDAGTVPTQATARPPLASATRTRSRPASGSGSMILPAVPPAAATTYPYGSAYGSMRDLNASDQAEVVRQREGGMLAGRSASDASAKTVRGVGVAAETSSPVLSAYSVEAGQDLPSMLREAAAGRWSFE